MIYIIVLSVIIAIGLIFGLMIIINFSKPSERHPNEPSNEDINVETVSIPTKNNKKLFAWWISAEKQAPTIVLVHGWGRNVSRLVPYLKNLQHKGFNLLAFDTRHHGNSDADGFSSMVKYAQDISACIDFVENKAIVDNNKFYLVGLSIGGAASIYAAAADDRIRKVVTIGAPSNPAQVMAIHIRKKHIPQPIIWSAFKVMEFRIGRTFKQLASERNISKTKAKVLLIHGTKDKTVPFSQAELILKSANKGQAKLWSISGKGHSNCHFEVGFWDRIIKFISS